MRSWRSVPRSISRTNKCQARAHALTSGAPAEAQRSGFGGERTSKGVVWSFRRKAEAEHSGLCEDAGAFLEKRAEKHFQNK